MLFLPPPSPDLQACVTIPAKDEAATILTTLAALEGQRTEAFFEVLLLANNCSDDTAELARRIANASAIPIHVLEVEFPPLQAHVGSARKVLMDLACDRLQQVGRSNGWILCTDADTIPDRDWVEATLGNDSGIIEGVAGAITVSFAGVELEFPAVAGYHRMHETFEALRCQIASRYEPVTHEPDSYHATHCAASLAIRADVYAVVGGMPELAADEDIELYRRVLASGGVFRHSREVRVTTSGRQLGRACGGLATALGAWRQTAECGGDYLVESPQVLMRYYQLRSMIRECWDAKESEWENTWEELSSALSELKIDSEQFSSGRQAGRPLEEVLFDLDRHWRSGPLIAPQVFQLAKQQGEALLKRAAK